MNETIALLKALLGSTIPVYWGAIPEGTVKPCVSVTEVSNSSTRVISGNKYGRNKVNRVTVYGTSAAQVADMLATIETLDNTSNDDFQRIFADYVLTEPKQPGAVLSRAFYDLTLYNR